MQKLLLLGAEAIAQGAIDGGMSGVYAYPGTPSTEITEYIQNNKTASERKIHSQWSANEKTAMEAALGMSYAGRRAMVCMKHVGLNVAADAFINSAITGVNGGLIVTVADDPSMHSSQNEQDSRFYGKFAMIPILEPSNARKRYKGLLAVQDSIEDDSEKSKYNIYYEAASQAELVSASMGEIPIPTKSGRNDNDKLPKHSLGIIACGIAYNYIMENYLDRNCPYPILKLGQYPLPYSNVEKIVNECQKVLVLEDGHPFVEVQLKSFLDKSGKIKGRLDGTISRDGELNPDIVGKALGKPVKTGMPIPKIVTNRPPELCSGCSHRDIYNALNETMEEFGKQKVFSDIGCYALGALPPWNAINSCVDMGASITMAKGAADAGVRPSVAVIGDSTFTHSGMTALLDCVYENTPVTVIISDNSTTAMTGGQASHATGRLEEICIGLGVKPEHVRT